MYWPAVAAWTCTQGPGFSGREALAQGPAVGRGYHWQVQLEDVERLLACSGGGRADPCKCGSEVPHQYDLRGLRPRGGHMRAQSAMQGDPTHTMPIERDQRCLHTVVGRGGQVRMLRAKRKALPARRGKASRSRQVHVPPEQCKELVWSLAAR